MPTVVMIPTARPTFAVEAASARAESARALLTDLGAHVVGPSSLVMTPGDVAAAAKFLDPSADLVVNVCASFSDAGPALQLYGESSQPVLLWAFREPGPVGDRLWLNSLCGANLFGHALVRQGGSVRLLYGNPDERHVRESLEDALLGRLPEPPALVSREGDRAPVSEVQPALEAMRGRRMGLVGEAPPGFTPSEYDGHLLSRVLGLEIEQLSVEDTFIRVAEVTERDREAELSGAVIQRPTLGRLSSEHLGRFAAVTSALRDWAADERLIGLAVRCWPEFPTELGVCPCSSLSRLADEGMPTACERDVYGTATMLLLEALGAGPTYLVDTVDLDAGQNLVRLWHCGSAATQLAADGENATQSVHCNRKIGVTGDFPLKTGAVILARLTEDSEAGHLRLLLASGESVPEANRFQGNTAAVHLDVDAEAFVQALVTGGFPHHTVLAWTDVRPQLRTAADLLGIPVVEW